MLKEYKTAKISTANTPDSYNRRQLILQTLQLSALLLQYVYIHNFCIYSLVRHEQMQQFPKSEYRQRSACTV